MLTHPSPNFKARPAGTVVDTIVLHASAGKSDAGDVSWIQAPASGISYHVLVGRDGRVYRFVDPRHQAYHAGVSEFRGRKFCNRYSIGVAFANRHDGVEPLTQPQIAAMRTVLRELCAAYPIKHITTHGEVSPGRKTDPHRIPNFVVAEWTPLPGDAP
jgi:N-acetyl-anhydromuramyl-L-alanine amidase AmpD